MSMKNCILERASHELSMIAGRCLQAVREIESGHPDAAVEGLHGLSEKLNTARNRLLVLHDAEDDAALSPYLIKPAPGPVFATQQ